jgi:hypothetical protein
VNQTKHNQILNQVAKDKFLPLQISQLGKSRTWIYDSIWWVCAIEFQPSSWDRGTYLNIGVCWLWNRKDYISYDYAVSHNPRIENFQKYLGEDSFNEVANKTCEKACELVSTYCEFFENISCTAKKLREYCGDMIWDKYHCGVSSGLAKEYNLAKKTFNQLLDMNVSFEWEIDLQNRTTELIDSIDAGKFEELILSEIIETRKLLKLKEVVINKEIFA